MSSSLDHNPLPNGAVAERITESHEIAKAHQAFHRIFRSADPFDKPFMDDTSRRTILYPTGYGLDSVRLAVVASAAIRIGESAAYFSGLEGYDGTNFERYDHHRILLDPRVSHQALMMELMAQGWPSLVESAVYSASGLWGILTSHERHAVVGGPKPFMDELSDHLPLRDDGLAFLSYWKYIHEDGGVPVNWIPALLNHIYGAEQAQEMFATVGLVVP